MKVSSSYVQTEVRIETFKLRFVLHFDSAKLHSPDWLTLFDTDMERQGDRPLSPALVKAAFGFWGDDPRTDLDK